MTKSHSALALVLAVLFTAALPGCVHQRGSVGGKDAAATDAGDVDMGDAEQERGVAEVIRVEGPLIVAFAPPELRDEIDKEVPGASEAMEHIEFALADTELCIGDGRVELKLVVASELTIEQDGRRDRVALPVEWPKSVGAYLFAPGREPCVIHAAAGPSSLSVMLPQAAGEYYGVAACLGDDSPSRPYCPKAR